MTILRSIWLLPLVFIFTACPYESVVPLTKSPSEPVDSSLIGYWYGIVKDGSDFFGIEALDISQKTDSIYSITRYGKSIKGDMIMPDTAYYTGYISRVGDLKFMSVQGMVKIPSRKSKTGYEEQTVFYLSFINVSNDTLSIKTISEDFTVKKDFRNPDDLRMLVTALTREQKNIFDDLYSLNYKKMEKPGR